MSEAITPETLSNDLGLQAETALRDYLDCLAASGRRDDPVQQKYLEQLRRQFLRLDEGARWAAKLRA